MSVRGWQVASAAMVALVTVARADTPTERFLSPARGEALAPGAIVEVRWTSFCAGRTGRIDEAEIILSLDGGLTFPIRVSQELDPCETRFLWRVPMLATGRARLALRTGSEGFGETERIALTSADFRILSDLDGRVQELYRRAAEWWTPPEATFLTAEDLFGGAMSSAAGRILAPFVSTEIGAPPAPASVSPVRTLLSRASIGAPVAVRCEIVSPRAPRAAIPLRL
jgi:hypothetical protein